MYASKYIFSWIAIAKLSDAPAGGYILYLHVYVQSKALAKNV